MFKLFLVIRITHKLLPLLLLPILLGMAFSTHATSHPENRIWADSSYSGQYSAGSISQAFDAYQESLGTRRKTALESPVYLYCQGNPVNMVDPSGNWSLMEAIYGNLVQKTLERGFISGGADRVNDKSINQILEPKKNFPVVGAARPDFVDRKTGEVWEIKPAHRIVEAERDLLYYLTLLDMLDPKGRSWKPGSPESYKPPRLLPIAYGTYALIDEPSDGIILYEVIDLPAIGFGVGIAGSAAYDMTVGFSAGTLTSLSFGF